MGDRLLVLVLVAMNAILWPGLVPSAYIVDVGTRIGKVFSDRSPSTIMTACAMALQMSLATTNVLVMKHLVARMRAATSSKLESGVYVATAGLMAVANLLIVGLLVFLLIKND